MSGLRRVFYPKEGITMRRSTALQSGLLAALLLPSIALAAPEELVPETARDEISQTSGVVLVDLFAYW